MARLTPVVFCSAHSPSVHLWPTDYPHTVSCSRHARRSKGGHVCRRTTPGPDARGTRTARGEFVLGLGVQAQEPLGPALAQGCSRSFVSDCGCVRVLVNAERLTKSYPSHETLLFGRGKDAFAFRDCDGDDGFVFGSKNGEYCLLRIRIENSPDGQKEQIDSIVDVQMLYQSGGTLNLKTAEGQQHPHYKEVVALLEPAALSRRVSSGSPADLEKSCSRDMRFQLHIQVALADSARQVDIAKTICWRTISSARPSMLPGGHGVGWKLMSSIFGAGPLFQSAKGDAKIQPRVHRKDRQRSGQSEVSWRASL